MLLVASCHSNTVKASFLGHLEKMFEESLKNNNPVPVLKPRYQILTINLYMFFVNCNTEKEAYIHWIPIVRECWVDKCGCPVCVCHGAVEYYKDSRDSLGFLRANNSNFKYHQP